jgi:hypothetical protein
VHFESNRSKKPKEEEGDTKQEQKWKKMKKNEKEHANAKEEKKGSKIAKGK